MTAASLHGGCYTRAAPSGAVKTISGWRRTSSRAIVIRSCCCRPASPYLLTRQLLPLLVERTALGRLGDADDIRKVIATLASDDWAWITGENIEVSGGFDL